MNIQKLKEAEAAFLVRCPQGFDDPDPWMEKIRKSHNVDRLADFTRANLTEATLSQPQRFADTLLKIVSRSSMVSRFEKPPFREFMDALSSKDQRHFAEAFRKRLFGRKQREDLHYHPRPDWEFYVGYRKLIMNIKKQVDPSLTPNNAATTGFLMATM